MVDVVICSLKANSFDAVFVGYVPVKTGSLHPLTQIFSITSVLKQVQRFCLKLFLPFCCLV